LAEWDEPIDGSWYVGCDTLKNQKLTFCAVNFTQSIDLSTSWTPSTVKFNQLPADPRSPVNNAAAWPDASDSSIYIFSGELSYTSNSVEPHKPLYNFKPDGNGGGSWSQPATTSAYSSLIQPAGGSFVGGNGTGLYLGGVLTDRTAPSVPENSIQPVDGLITFDMSSGIWSSSDATAYQSAQTVHFGMSHWLGGIGKQGLALFMGGQTSDQVKWTGNEAYYDMSDIVLYDPSTKSWYHQTATGQIPEGRQAACVTGAQGDNGTYEM
jgi:hypothetical protein